MEKQPHLNVVFTAYNNNAKRKIRQIRQILPARGAQNHLLMEYLTYFYSNLNLSAGNFTILGFEPDRMIDSPIHRVCHINRKLNVQA